jgi:hypothetical protein
MKNVTKDSIASHLNGKLGMSKKLFDDVVTTVFDEIVLLAIQDSYIKIKNFGSFNLSKKPERPGNIINEKKQINIEERLVMKFSPSRSLKDKLNKIT